jgi:hypothetical protein
VVAMRKPMTVHPETIGGLARGPVVPCGTATVMSETAVKLFALQLALDALPIRSVSNERQNRPDALDKLR